MSIKDLISSLNLSSKTKNALIIFLLTGVASLVTIVLSQKETIVYQTIKNEDEKVINTIKDSFDKVDDAIDKKLTVIRKENSSLIKRTEERIIKHVDRKINNIKDGMEVMMDKIPLSQTEIKLLKKLLDKKEDESYNLLEYDNEIEVAEINENDYPKYNLSYTMPIDTTFFIKTLKPLQSDSSVKVKKNKTGLINKLFGKKKYIKNNNN